MNHTTHLTIREAARDDLRETCVIHLECKRSDYTFLPREYLDALTVEDDLASCEEWLYQSGQPCRMYVAMDGQRMAGFIAVGPNIGWPNDRDGEVNAFFVRPAYRRMGVGLRLLQAGLEYLRGLGYHEVVIFNYRRCESNGFYRRLGGKIVHQEIQDPGGIPLETDVFGYPVETLLETVNERLARFAGTGS